MSRHHDIVTISVDVLHKTEKAFLIETEVTKEAVWVPKSLVVYDSDDGTMQMTEAFAINKGLI